MRKINPDKPVSIGIISPFRAQVEQLKLSVPKVLSDYMIKNTRLKSVQHIYFSG